MASDRNIQAKEIRLQKVLALIESLEGGGGNDAVLEDYREEKLRLEGELASLRIERTQIQLKLDQLAAERVALEAKVTSAIESLDHIIVGLDGLTSVCTYSPDLEKKWAEISANAAESKRRVEKKLAAVR